MHRLTQAMTCLGLAAGTAAAAPLVLTGLSRIGGETRAFFGDATTGSYFSLSPGEDRSGVRLLEVQFKDHSVLVADRTGTNRIVFGSNDRPSSLAQRTALMYPDRNGSADRPERRLAAVAGMSQGPESQPAPETLSLSGAAGGNPAGLAGLADGAATQPAAAASPDAVPTPPPRRRATADELFKARNGYSAWEDLLRQRHQADLLAIPPTANENP
jgi:hypothetical protein